MILHVSHPTNVNAENIQDFKLTRKYNNVSLNFVTGSFNENIQESDQEIKWRILKEISSSLEISLTWLKLQKTTMKPEYIECLSKCTVIATLWIEDCSCVDFDSPQIKPTKFKMLEELNIVDVSTVILSMIKCERLENFQLFHTSKAGGDSHHIITFLNQLESLNELLVCFSNGRFDNRLLKPKFTLQTLSLVVTHKLEDWEDSTTAKLIMTALCNSLCLNGVARINFTNSNFANPRHNRFPELANIILNQTKKIIFLELQSSGLS